MILKLYYQAITTVQRIITSLIEPYTYAFNVYYQVNYIVWFIEQIYFYYEAYTVKSENIPGPPSLTFLHRK